MDDHSDRHLQDHSRDLRHRVLLAVPHSDDGMSPWHRCARAQALPARRGDTWTATILAGTLAMFGAGWENIVFAIQLVYNLSLLAFLVHLILIDHDGPPDRRDAFGLVAGLVAVASSGFGPFFIVATLLFTVLRRRWKAAAIATIPTGLASAWWWLFWGQDPAGGSSRSLSQMPPYVNRGLTAVFQGLTTTDSLVGISLIATLAVLLWRRRDGAAHDLMFSLAVTALLIYVGLGIERAGLGIETAGAVPLCVRRHGVAHPRVRVAVDQLARIASPALWAGRLLLLGATAMNISALRTNGDDWAKRAIAERNVLELVAASPTLSTVEGGVAPSPFSPDVRIVDLPELIADGAIPSTRCDDTRRTRRCRPGIERASASVVASRSRNSRPDTSHPGFTVGKCSSSVRGSRSQHGQQLRRPSDTRISRVPTVGPATEPPTPVVDDAPAPGGRSRNEDRSKLGRRCQCCRRRWVHRRTSR